jgi:uncharacterized protein with von Willebrand factor type A (vWA) domain
MNSLDTIKSNVQVVEDNLGLVVNDINVYQTYRKKQDLENVLLFLAIFYENNTPTENVSLNLNVKVQEVYTSDGLTRIHLAFVHAAKVFTLICSDGLS